LKDDEIDKIQERVNIEYKKLTGKAKFLKQEIKGGDPQKNTEVKKE